MKRREYRSLLPAEDNSDQQFFQTSPLSKKPRNLRIACDACRVKKVACTGEKPTCAPCLKRGTACVYREDKHHSSGEVNALQQERDDLKTQLSDHVKLLDQLKTLPDDQAFGLFQRLRATSNSPGVLSNMNGSMHNRRRPSDILAARGMAPSTGSSLEHELAARHVLIYPKLEPLDADPLKNLVESTLFKARSWRVGQANSPVSVLTVNSAAPLPVDEKFIVHGQDQISVTSTMSILGPAPPPKYCDPRLSRLRIGFWTRVAISNDLAAALISFYLENDHPIMGMFDADLFLDDLVEHRLTYCSAMLVTAVLYLSCQAYTRSDVRSSSFVPEFLDEARTLWLAEQNPDLAGTLAAAERITDPITTIAAAELMALGCQVNGQNDLGYDFLNAGRQMAERIGLINTPPTSPKLRYIASKSPEWISAASHVAWGTYNWLSVHGLYFRDPPIAHPPNLPVPAERSSTIDRQLDSSESHEDFRPAPAYMGSTFSTMCRFWTIVQEVAVVYFKHDKRSLSQRVPLAFAEAKYQRLLAWTDTLAMGMARGEYSPAHVLIFHMNFHSVVMQLFHPFVREQSSFSKHRLRSFSSEDSCLANVFNASLNQLGRLMFIYQRSCVSATWSIFVNPPLVQLADAMLAARFSRTTHGRLFFLLCISAWLDLYESYYFFWDIVKGFLARAMRDGTMTSNEAKSLMAELRRRGAHHGTPKLASSSIIIDFDRAAANPDEARTRAIAEQFDELALQEELTTGDYEEK